MSEKKRLAITVDAEVYEHVQQKPNMSHYIQTLVEKVMRGNNVDTTGIELQIQTLEEQAQAAAEREAMYQDRIEELRRIMNKQHDEKEADIAAAKDVLEGVPKDPSNEAIQKWATKIGMSPQQLIERLETTP